MNEVSEINETIKFHLVSLLLLIGYNFAQKTDLLENMKYDKMKMFIVKLNLKIFKLLTFFLNLIFKLRLIHN